MYIIGVMAKKAQGIPVQEWFDEEEKREPGFIGALDEANLRTVIAAYVKDLREKAEITQAELAAKIGTTQPGVARVEAGKTMPDLATLHKIANALGHLVVVTFKPMPGRGRSRKSRG